MAAPKRIFPVEPAVRQSVPLLVGVMGCSGSGKTYSGLRMATGIQRVVGGDIFVIDTEQRRALHYADQFKFKHVRFEAPFGSLDYLAAIEQCVEQGAKVIMIDSLSHEHTGLGGYLLTQESEVERMAGNDMAKRERVKMAGWIKPAAMRQKMINGIVQLNANFVFCFRAKEKTKPKSGGGIQEMGFMPVAGEELLFEMTVNCLLMPRCDGVPTWRSDMVGERLMMKLPQQFKSIFAESAPLSEDIGEKMSLWANGDGQRSTPATATEKANTQPPTLPENPAGGIAEEAPSPPAGPPIDESERLLRVEHVLRAAADGGYQALKEAWNVLTPADTRTFKAMRDRQLIPRAREVDAANKPAPATVEPPTDGLLI